MVLHLNFKGLIGYLWKMSLQVPIVCLKRDVGFSEGASPVQCSVVQRHLTQGATPTGVRDGLSRSKALWL